MMPIMWLFIYFFGLLIFLVMMSSWSTFFFTCLKFESSSLLTECSVSFW